MKLLKSHIAIVLILIVGAGLRFGIAGTHSYSNDEMSAVSRLRFDNFSDLIEYGVMKGDMHPAGVQVGMKVWSYIGGVGEFGMRFPFVIMGLLSIFMTYFLGLRWFNKNTGIVAAGLLALLYFPIMNSEFARPYSPGLLISLMTAWFYYKVLIKECHLKWRNSILLGVSFALGMYTHYFCFLFLLWVGMTGLVFLRKDNIKWYLISAVTAILLFLPHYNVTHYHMNVGGLQWLGPPENDWLFDFLFHVFNESIIVVSSLCILLLAALLAKKTDYRINYKFLGVCAMWFFGIYIVGHIVSVTYTPLLKFPVMLFALPFFLLIIGALIARFKYLKIVLPVFFAVVAYSTVFEKELFGNMHFGLLKEPAEKITEWTKKYGADNVHIIHNTNNPGYLNYYATQWGDSIQFDRDYFEYGDDRAIWHEIRSTDAQYCAVGYSARPTVVNVFETVKEEFPYIVDGEKYYNSGVYLLSKNPEDEKIKQKEERIAVFPNEPSGGWIYNEEKVLRSNSGIVAYESDSSNIYGPTFEFKISDYENFRDKYLKISTCLMGQSGGQLTVTISGERNGEVIQYRDENFWLGYDFDAVLDMQPKVAVPLFTQYSVRIPDYIQDDDKLKISFWNRNNETMHIGPVVVYLLDNIWN